MKKEKLRKFDQVVLDKEVAAETEKLLMADVMKFSLIAKAANYGSYLWKQLVKEVWIFSW